MISEDDALERACVFLKWSKMAIIPFCTFLPVLKKTAAQTDTKPKVVPM